MVIIGVLDENINTLFKGEGYGGILIKVINLVEIRAAVQLNGDVLTFNFFFLVLPGVIYSRLSSAEVENERSYTHTHLHAFLASTCTPLPLLSNHIYFR